MNMEKKTFVKRLMLWTAVAVAVFMLILGLCVGKVIEDSLIEEIGKWIVMSLGVIGICEVLVAAVSPLLYHVIYDKKNEEDLGMD